MADNASNGDTCYDALKELRNAKLLALGVAPERYPLWRQRCLSHVINLVARDIGSETVFIRAHATLAAAKKMLKLRKNKLQRRLQVRSPLYCSSSTRFS